MDPTRCAELIEQKYHPGSKTFTRVPSEELRSLLELPLPVPEDIWSQWETIEEQLAQKNLIMFPPLPEARPGEDVRVYRKNAPLTQLLEAMLFPTGQNDITLAKAISALHLNQTRQVPPRPPEPAPESGEARQPENRNRPDNNGPRPPRPENRRFDRGPGHRTGGQKPNGPRKGQQQRKKGPPHGSSSRPQSSNESSETPNYQDFDRRTNRPLA